MIVCTVENKSFTDSLEMLLHSAVKEVVHSVFDCTQDILPPIPKMEAEFHDDHMALMFFSVCVDFHSLNFFSSNSLLSKFFCYKAHTIFKIPISIIQALLSAQHQREKTE